MIFRDQTSEAVVKIFFLEILIHKTTGHTYFRFIRHPMALYLLPDISGMVL